MKENDLGVWDLQRNKLEKSPSKKLSNIKFMTPKCGDVVGTMWREMSLVWHVPKLKSLSNSPCRAKIKHVTVTKQSTDFTLPCLVLNFNRQLKLRSGRSVCNRMGKLVVQVQPEHLPLCKTFPPHWLAQVWRLICSESISSLNSFMYFQSVQAF